MINDQTILTNIRTSIFAIIFMVAFFPLLPFPALAIDYLMMLKKTGACPNCELEGVDPSTPLELVGNPPQLGINELNFFHVRLGSPPMLRVGHCDPCPALRCPRPGGLAAMQLAAAPTFNCRVLARSTLRLHLQGWRWRRILFAFTHCEFSPL
jgi:hypothetical protein